MPVTKRGQETWVKEGPWGNKGYTIELFVTNYETQGRVIAYCDLDSDADQIVREHDVHASNPAENWTIRGPWLVDSFLRVSGGYSVEVLLNARGATGRIVARCGLREDAERIVKDHGSQVPTIPTE